MKLAGRLLSLLAGATIWAGAAVAQDPPTPSVPTALFIKPAGPYAVGTLDHLWIDDRRPESFTRDPDDRRHLMVQIWYPADLVTDGERAPYIANADEFGEFAGFKHVLHVKTNSTTNAQVARDGDRFPVLIYSHGGSWTRFSATFETEWLASHGYVVVSVDHTGFSKTALFPDGYRFKADTLTFPVATGTWRADALAGWAYLGKEVFPTWTADISFVLDRLEQLERSGNHPLRGRLDLTRIGALGWSFGGAASIQVSKDDPRIKAVVDQDGQLFGDVRDQGTGRPFMLMHHGAPTRPPKPDAGPALEELIAMIRGWDRSLRARSTADWYDLRIADTHHAHFSDLTLYSPTEEGTALDPRRAHEIINAYTLAFFDRYLRGKSSDLLNGPSPLFPEVTLEKQAR